MEIGYAEARGQRVGMWLDSSGSKLFVWFFVWFVFHALSPLSFTSLFLLYAHLRTVMQMMFRSCPRIQFLVSKKSPVFREFAVLLLSSSSLVMTSSGISPSLLSQGSSPETPLTTFVAEHALQGIAIRSYWSCSLGLTPVVITFHEACCTPLNLLEW